MRGFLWRGLGLCVFALAAALPASAQTYSYTVYVDGDRDPATGCSVTLPGSTNTVTGAETRLVATVDQPTLQVTSVVRQTCSGGSFSGGANVGGGYPVGLNNGVGGTDVIELSDNLVALAGGLSTGQVRIYFAAANAGASDALFTPTGAPGPNGIFVGTPFLIPFLGLGGLLLLVGGFALIAWRFHGRYPNAVRASAVVLLVGAGVAIAANFVSDGQIGDWTGVPPSATDPAGDSTDGNQALDIRAGFGAFENDRLFFRIDVTDAENNPPVANPVTATVLEDSGATTLTLTGSDLDSDPLTFAIVTPPTRGVLGAITPVNATSATVTYTPNANANGTDTFTFRANDGQINSANATATITITPVNDAPGFTATSPAAVNEDAGAQTIANWATFNPGPPDEAGQTATYTVSAVSNPALFSAAPAVAPNGTLTYTPAANANGTSTYTVTVQDSGGTANGGVNVSPPQTFTITVNAINDAPSFTAGANQTVNEDAGAQTVNPWATAISAGPPDEAGQTLTFNVTGNTNAALFSAAPAVSPTGVLTYTPAANANGTATITLTLSDNGPGAPPPNANTSAPQSFTITVSAVNDAPVNTLPAAVTTNEDTAVAFTAANAVSVADVDAGTSPIQVTLTSTGGTAGVAVTAGVTITGNNSALVVLTGPQAGINTALAGLSFAPTANFNGGASLTVTTSDQGNTGSGGALTDTDTITITVTAINDAPVFTAGANQTVNEDAGAQTVNPWATAISAGPPDEAGQTLTFNVTGNTNAALFSAAPAVSPAGVLTYTPAPNANGTATITLTLSDNGAAAPPPNANTSPAQSFTITVNAVNDAPVNTVPAAQATGDTVPLVLSTANANAISVADVDAGTGLVQMTFATGAAANGTLSLANPGGVLATVTGNGTETVVATGTITALNTALNGPSGALTYTPVAGTTAARTITVTTNDQGNTGAGGPQTDIDTITVNVDAPPVVTSNPANGAVIAQNAAIAVNFSEPVNVTAGITFTCTGGTLSGLGGTTGSNVTALNLTYSGVLGGTCTLTVPAASVTDVDVIDPPNNPTAPYTATFTVDAAPTVTATTPANGATVASNASISVSFSEPVDITSAADFSIECPTGSPIGYTVTSPPALPASTTSVTIVPVAALPAGATCTLTVFGSIADSDTIDPPNNIGANFTSTFTVDAAPAFVSSNPAANGAVVGTGQAVSFTFSENVANLGTAITLNCGSPVTGTISGGGTPTLTFTPATALTPGASCTATAVAAQIGDSDTVDPPQNPVADVVRTFTVDSAPTITGVTPANAAVNVGLASNITVTFSELVNFAPAAFTLECPGGSAIPFTVSGSGTNTATIDPTPATLPINTLCVFTANAALITDVDAADPPDAGTGTTSVSFTTVNDQPPSVATTEVEIGNTFTALPLGPGIGSDSNTQIRLTFSETVNPSGAWAQLLCTVSGSRTVLSGLAVTVLDPVFVLTPSVNLTAGESCTLTVFATLITDDDAIDPPDNMVANFVTTFDVDAVPAVTTVAPANGATAVATNSTITVNFSEPVNIAAGGITLNCGAPVSFSAGLPANNVSSIVLTPTAPLPETATCNGTVVNTLVTDVDPSDPPNQMVANFTWSFTTVDQAPAVGNAAVEVGNVFTNLPLGAGTFADPDTDLRVTFSELVNPSANWASLTCTSSGTQSVGGGSLVVSAADPVFTLNPATNLTPGEGCTLTVFAAQVTDDDTIDPPNQMAADAVFTFTVRDVAPTVTSSTPLAAATVPNTQAVTLNFSEPVNLAAGSVAFSCGAAVPFTPALPQSNVTSLVLTPTAALPNGVACTVTLTSTGVTDVDAIDPPNELDGNNSGDIIDGDADNFVLNFSVDQAPSVTSTTPANGATNVLPTSTITLNFSESVVFDTVANAANTSFDLECPAATPVNFAVTTVSPANSVVLNPDDNAVAGQTCVLTVRAAGITDSDAVDPPNNMLADFSATIAFAAVAENDAYTVTPHLTLTIPTTGVQGGGTAANDILGAGTITGFGFAPTCTGTAPGSQLNAGAGNGRLTLNANGSFVYEPPAGIINVTRTFCYTVTGNDTANIEFSVQNQSRVWFVNAAAAPSGDGTQARPFNALTGAGSFDAVAADGDNDTIYIEGDQTGGLTLRPGQRVIGGGSTATIATFSGVTAIAGSGFPAPSGTPPVITCSNVTCLTLNNSGATNTHSLRGFTIGDSGATGTDIGGTNFGTLTVAELTLTGSGTTMNLATGTLNGTFLDLNTNAGSGSLTLSAVGGTWSVQNQVDITGVLIGAFSIANMPASGGVTLTGGMNVSLGNGSINLTSNASPINLGNVLLNTTTSMTVSGSSGLTTITGGSLTTPVNTLVVANSAVNITLSTLTSSGGAPGPNLSATNFTGSINIASGNMSNTQAGNTAVVLTNNAGTFSFGGQVAKNTAGRVIDISGGTGNVTFSGIVSCFTSCGTGAGNEGLRVTGRTGGTVTFSGGTKQFSSTATNPAVVLTSNAGGTINFTGGGLAITTTTGTGFNATGGGTISVQGAGNTVTTTTGSAVNVSATTIGAGGMSFQSVNTTGATANVAINLANTGSGPFSVTGTGTTAGSGGTISNKSDDAIRLNNTGGLVTLDRMIIEDIGDMAGAIDTRSGHDAIEGLNVSGGLSLTGTTIRRISDQAIHGGVQGSPDTPTVWTGLTLSGVTIENTNRYHIVGSGDANNEGTVRILGIRGTVNVTNSTFSLGAQPLDLEVTSGTLNLTATGNSFDRSYKEFTSGTRASIGNHCVDVRVLAGATANVTLGDRVSAALANNFVNCRLGSVRVVNQPGAGANTDVIIARNNFRVNDHSSGIGGNFDFPMGGTLVWNLGSGTVDTIVENNLFELVTNASGGVGQLTLIAQGGPVQALVQSNTFDRPGNAPWLVQSRGSAASVMTARFVGNTVIRGAFPCTIDIACGGGYFAPGLRALSDAQDGATLNFTMENNLMARHDTGFDPGQTIEVRALNTGAGPTVCSRFLNNQSPDGYSLEQLAGTVRTVAAAGSCAVGSPSPTCQTVFQGNGNLGGAGVNTTNPPFVNVFGTVTVNNTACPIPTGGPF